MKKPIFTALLATLAALMLTGCTSRHEAANGSKVTTSPDIAQMQTANPTAEHTAEPTAEPTPEPTEAPSEAPNPYCMEEYEQLLKFFELKDENGVKNGEKCFKNYDPARIEFWGKEREDSYDSWLFWDENGYLTQIYLRGTEDDPIELTGEFKLHGISQDMPDDTTFIYLESIMTYNTTFESIFIKNCHVDDVYLNSVKDAFFIDSNANDDFVISSESHSRYVSSFTVDLTSEGNGKVSVSGGVGDVYYNVYVHAEPIEGHKFLGWYDADGKLISAEAEFELSYEHDTGFGVHDFTGIAKFE